MERREFLKVSAATGAALTLAVSLDGCGAEEAPATPVGSFAPNAWIRIDDEGTVTVMVDRAEMGQGVSTALPMLVAEELDADWSRVRFEAAPANEAYYNPLLKAQITGGSTSIPAAWTPLRRAGAAARAMLLSAAALEWGVEVTACRTEAGAVVHEPSGRRAGYGVLVPRAATLAVPDQVSLKPRTAYRLIGTPVPRLDIPDKVTGRARFGADAGPVGVLVAVVARCPVFGGKVVRYDGARALAVPGVKQVVPIDSGVAVVAEHTWAALEGRKALEVTWNEGPDAMIDDAAVRAELQALTGQAGASARHLGDSGGVNPPTRIEAVYEVPYLAHATMEPMNCTADVSADGVTLWVPTQFQAGPSYFAGGGARGVAASVAGVGTDRVTVHTTMLGGGFGRRSELDMVREAVAVSKAVGAPVRLQWTREDDTRHDQYRPAARHVMTGGLAADGTPVLWQHHIACQSIIRKFMPGFLPRWATRIAGPLKGGVDPNAIEGAVDLPYAIPNQDVRYSEATLPIPVGFWRSVGHSHTAFAVESFIDEMAQAGGKDPVEFRRWLLREAPRHLAVLDLAAERAGWGTEPPKGRFRGVAVHESFGSFVAQVAEVSVEQETIRVHRVTCAIDCGVVVNPDIVKAQMEGGIAYGLSAALFGGVTIDKGRVRQGNFNDYRVLRIDEMPVIDVHLVPSDQPPGGAGEPATPPIAPAVANAVFAATATRLRSLPLRLGARG
jgi:isoquinoline 1-oxidoreductase subunit beta